MVKVINKTKGEAFVYDENEITSAIIAYSMVKNVSFWDWIYFGVEK